MGVKDYSTNPDNNTQINGINIAEGCPPSGINNAVRQLMADVKADKDAQDKATVKTVNGNAPDAAGDVVLKAVITETWNSGASWYRKWSDGWIEQGGRIIGSNTSGHQTLHTAFSSDTYTLVGSGWRGDTSSIPSFIFAGRTSTSFSWGTSQDAAGISWYACGY